MGGPISSYSPKQGSLEDEMYHILINHRYKCEGEWVCDLPCPRLLRPGIG